MVNADGGREIYWWCHVGHVLDIFRVTRQLARITGHRGRL